jgi:hypothetical protein
MGKPYGHCYHFKGGGNQTGTMVCASCQKPIDGMVDDWMSYQKSKSHDWAFHCFHRRCYKDNIGWMVIEKRHAKAVARSKDILADLNAVAEKYGITDTYEFAESACLSIGGNLEDYMNY